MGGGYVSKDCGGWGNSGWNPASNSEAGRTMNQYVVAGTRTASPSAESELASFAAHYEGEDEITLYLPVSSPCSSACIPGTPTRIFWLTIETQSTLNPFSKTGSNDCKLTTVSLTPSLKWYNGEHGIFGAEAKVLNYVCSTIGSGLKFFQPSVRQ